jgi:Uma2 family endonuclease
MATVTKPRTRLTTRLGLRSSGVLMNTEEFDNLPASVFNRWLRYELINGVLIVTPPAGNGEVDPNEDLGFLLRYYQEFHPLGSIIDKVLYEQTIYATTNRRRADRAIWLGLGRVPDVKKDIPAIIVEFVSKQKRDYKRDYEEKKAEYLAIGVREYWIIDRFQRIMTVHRNVPEGVATLVIPETETYQTDLLPGFVLPLARILAKADDWPDKHSKNKKRNPPQNPLEGDPR